MESKRIRIEKPAAECQQTDDLWKEAQKYARLISEAPDPNLGRVLEIKEEIQKGHYIQPEMIDEAAARMAIRFLRKN